MLEAADITSPPVPIRDLVWDCGIQVLAWDFQDIDGLILQLDAGAVIWVNEEQPPTRKRFTLAHELGHHLLRHADTFHLDLGGDLAPNAAGGGHPAYDWRAERAANEFAANLVMPAAMVRRSAATLADVGARFHVQGQPGCLGFHLAALHIK